MKENPNAQNKAMDDKLLAIIKQLGDELQPGHMQHLSLTLDTSLDRELGFDSLSRVELLVRIEQAFDISIPEQVLASVETPRDFLRAIQGAGGRATFTAINESTVLDSISADTVPENAETLVQVLHQHAVTHPDRLHIRLYSDDDDGEVITYGELWDSARHIAGNLQQYGLKSGESVLIMLPTGRDYFTSFFGILLAGGVPVPMYPPGRMKQIEEHLRRHTAIAINSMARMMITMPEAKRFAQLMHHQVQTLTKVVTPTELEGKSHSPAECPMPNLTGKATAFLQYTSGSTGMPKGVVLSHANLLANIRTMGRVLKVTSNDVFISWLPLYHDMGLIGAWLGSLYYGCPFTVMSPLSFIAKPLRWLQAIHRYGGTLSAAPNFAYELCLRRIDDRDLEGLRLHKWRCAFNGAEAVSPSTLNKFIDRFKKIGFQAETMMPVYGLAESSVGLAFPLKRRAPLIDRVNRRTLMDTGKAAQALTTDHEVLEFVSCGQPLPGHQIRIVDDSDRELPDRHQGRLQFSGPSSTSGYFRNQKETSRLFHDTWLNSGDLGYIADGDIYITGRSKDIIIRAGRNIYPTELEEAISNIEGILKGNVAVFGSVDAETATERLIVLAETRKRKPDALTALRISINTVINDLCGTPPDEVVLAPPNTVLKTSSGKIRRAASRALYEQDQIGKAQQAVWLQIARFSLSGIKPQLRRLWHRLAAIGFAGYAWLLFGLATPIVWILVVMLPVESWRWRCIQSIVRMISRCTAVPILVQGLDNLPSKGGSCILVSNHASYLDGMILAAIVPSCFSFIAKKELQQHFLVRLPLRRLGTEFVERFNQQQGIEDARSLMRQKQTDRSLLFFAEGTFMRMPGLLPFRMGAFETAVAGELAMIPLAIRGTRSILRADSWFPRRGAITVIIGKPVQSAEFLMQTQDRWTAAIHLRDKIRTWILRHCGEPDLQHEKPTPLQNNRQSEG